VAWLRAQLDEDERVARGADAGRWLPEDKGITFEYRADDFHEGEAQARLVADSRANQEHIAEWGPARVLREVESKRRLLDYLVDLENKALDGNWWNLDTVEPLRLLALPFADRPGYREDWRP
jgi:hypothetical protein